MRDNGRSGIASGSSRASGDADFRMTPECLAASRVVVECEVSGSSGSDISLPPVSIRSVGRGITFSWQEELQAVSS